MLRVFFMGPLEDPFDLDSGRPGNPPHSQLRGVFPCVRIKGPPPPEISSHTPLLFHCTGQTTK